MLQKNSILFVETNRFLYSSKKLPALEIQSQSALKIQSDVDSQNLFHWRDEAADLSS